MATNNDTKQPSVDKMYTSPSRYVQGIDLIDLATSYLKPLGNNPLIIADETVWDIAGPDLEASLKEDDMGATDEIFGGEASMKEIDHIADKADNADTDVIIGLG